MLKACRCFSLPYQRYQRLESLENCKVYIADDVVEVFGYDGSHEVSYKFFFIDRRVRKSFLQHLLDSPKCRAELGVSYETVLRLLENS